VSCPLCEKRKANRFCPAKSEQICAVCCGTEREVTIDCPPDCPHLVSARRYEEEHRAALPPGELPFRDVELSSDLLHEMRGLANGLAFTILKYARDHAELRDSDAQAACEALAATFRTLDSGLLYEKPPAALLPQELYAALAAFVQEVKKEEAERAGFPVVKDSEVFQVLVLLARMARVRSNGRPRSRAFLDYLRAQFPPSPEISKEAPRIIVP
jgi:hypothetical protein